MKNQELYDISIEEFDKMNEKHVFSEKYKKNKQKMLKDYRKSVWSSTGAKTAKVAVACAAVLIASPVVANAASNGELFSRIWGKQDTKMWQLMRKRYIWERMKEHLLQVIRKEHMKM